MNAISPSQPNGPEDRTTRHLRLRAELADLAMQLARAAAARALTHAAEPEQPPAATRNRTPKRQRTRRPDRVSIQPRNASPASATDFSCQ